MPIRSPRPRHKILHRDTGPQKLLPAPAGGATRRAGDCRNPGRVAVNPHHILVVGRHESLLQIGDVEFLDRGTHAQRSRNGCVSLRIGRSGCPARTAIPPGARLSTSDIRVSCQLRGKSPPKWLAWANSDPKGTLEILDPCTLPVGGGWRAQRLIARSQGYAGLRGLKKAWGESSKPGGILGLDSPSDSGEGTSRGGLVPQDPKKAPEMFGGFTAYKK